jgi:hypothetical protein
MELLKSLCFFITGVFKRIYWILPTLILDPFEIAEKLFGVNYDVPRWAIWSLFAAGWVVAILLTYHELRMQKVALEQPTNCIEAYKAKHGKLPELPRELHNIFPQYKSGQPISRGLEAITPSTQFLRNLSYNQPSVEFLFSMLDWQKKDPRTYVAGSVGRPIVWSGQNPKEWTKDFVSYWQDIINDERRNKEKGKREF